MQNLNKFLVLLTISILAISLVILGSWNSFQEKQFDENGFTSGLRWHKSTSPSGQLIVFSIDSKQGEILTQNEPTVRKLIKIDGSTTIVCVNDKTLFFQFFPNRKFKV